MKELQLINIIVPVFFEEKTISKVINGIEKYVKQKHLILIIYDLYSDPTIEAARHLSKKYKTIKLLKNEYGRGVLNAVKTGFKRANGNLIVVMSSDLADDPKTINEMYKKMLEGYDVVSATRYARGGKRYEPFSSKLLLSRMAGFLTPLLLGIPTTDLTNGYKMYRKKVLKSIPIKSDGGWEFSMELLIKAKMAEYKIAEVPTISQRRKFGKSKFRIIKWLPKYLKWYVLGIFYRIKFLFKFL